MFEIDDGFINLGCEHTERDEVDVGIMKDVSRCLKCGDLFMLHHWHNIPRLVAALIITGSDAKGLVNYMAKAREENGIPYPDFSMEEYRASAAFLAGKHLTEVLENLNPVIRRRKNG